MESREAVPENTEIRIREATGAEMLRLWGYSDVDTAAPAARFFHDQIADGNAVFWALDDGKKILGELYAFLKLEDEDFADGCDTAYLCAFRVQKEYRGQGYGTEAVSALLDYGFDVLGLTRIHLKARLFNSRAIHVYEKCGFREYGRTEEHILMEVEKEKR